jgi:C4-dicarboxylate-specific signal transduction histidine kinase
MDAIRQKLQRISSQTKRASAIIDHMRIFGRDALEDAAPVSVKDAVINATDFVREQLRLSEIELDLRLMETCRNTNGHPIQLEQVILNLLTNARDAIEEKSKNVADKKKDNRITVQLDDSLSSGLLTLIVRDTGGGIPEEVVNRIFDPFYTTKEIGKGTGVGLSIAYGIITGMGGNITARNMDGGAEFVVTLPVAK